MTLFLFGGLFTLLTLLLILRPLFASTGEETQDQRESRIYQDQLDEIERDKARGVLSEGQAKAARVEIERRLLVALRRQDQDQPHVARKSRLVVAGLVAALPLGALAIYAAVGSPQSPDRPFATRDRVAEAAQMAPMGEQDIAARIIALEEQVAATPGDLESLTLLARSYASIGEFDRALEAYTSANRIAGGTDVELAGEYAEVMVYANEGTVPQTAEQIFAFIKQDFPNDPQATYYVALAKAQRGERQAALADLNALKATAPQGALWLDQVNALITQLNAAAIAELPEEQQAAMIQGMINGLAAKLEEDPDNVEGWQRLARAYEVLGETEKAAAAYKNVLRLSPEDAAAASFFAED